MRKLPFLIISTVLLISCNLTAQLIGGGREFAYTETYALQGDQHSFRVTFTVTDGEITGMTMEPQATTPSERAEQLAFSANVRRYVLEKAPAEVTLPSAIGEASAELMNAFHSAMEKLKEEVP